MSNRTAVHEAHSTTVNEAIPDARILVADEDDILRGVHEAVLSLGGYGTGTAADGEEALAMLAIADIDPVLTDCNMPRFDGIGLIRALHAAGNRIPAMLVSGSLFDGGDLPADVRGEVAVAPPAKNSQPLAWIARRALRPRTIAPGRTSIVDVFPGTASAPGKIRIAHLFPAADT